MGKVKKAKKIAKVARIKRSDDRLKISVAAQNKLAGMKKKKDIATKKSEDELVDVEQVSTSMFFKFNAKLGPPYRVLMDTNFINFSIQHKTDIFRGMMDCLMAKCIPIVTDCVVGELEKMGHRYRLALQTIKDPRIVRLTCQHKGTYADDCLVKRITEHRCYIVATSDKDLKQRIRKIPGVPIMYVSQHKFEIERMPDVMSAVPFSNAKIKAAHS